MKKLMITAAAALCATAAAYADGVESGVVGYASSSLNTGAKRILITPQFSTIGTSKAIRIGDIVPVSTSAVGNNRVIMYTLTNTGTTDQTYTWTGSYWKHNNTDASDETIPEGKGLWVLCNMSVATTLQSSGEVNTGNDIVVRLNGGAKRTALGNGFPSDVKFSDIVPESTTAVGNNRVIIYTLTNTGTTDQTYTWTGTYWKHNNADASNESLPAGKGIWVLCNMAATTPTDLRIRNPFNE